LGLNVVGQSYSFAKSIGYEGGPSNSLPWVLGADPTTGFQFGCLFNSPAMGGVVHTEKNTTWSIIGDAGNQKLRQQFDFLITTHSADAVRVPTIMYHPHHSWSQPPSLRSPRAEAGGEAIPDDGEVR
jgi:hypothetical protein